MYSRYKYRGYFKETPGGKERDRGNERLRFFSMDVPWLVRELAWDGQLVALNILVEKADIVEILQGVFITGKKPKERKLYSLLGNEKKLKIVARHVEVGERWVDYFIEPEFRDSREEERIFAQIELPIVKVEKIKKFQMPLENENFTVNKFRVREVLDIEEVIIERQVESYDGKSSFKEIKVINNTPSVNYKRQIFEIPLPCKTTVIEISDIRLKRRSKEEINLPQKKLLPPQYNPIQPVVLNNSYKITVVEKLSDIKKLSSNDKENLKKTVSFSNEFQNQLYSPQDHLTQISQIPLKIFMGKQIKSVRQIVNSISLEGCYIVGLELDEKYMNGMDLILAWQTGVKICDIHLLQSESRILEFLASIQEQIKKFDLILMIFLGNSKGIYPGIGVLDNCQKFLENFQIKLRYMIVDDIQSIAVIISEYLGKYLKFINNKEKWIYLQERISDITPTNTYECLNTYCFHVFELIKMLRNEEFIEMCNYLGTSNLRFEALLNLKNNSL